MFHAAIAAALIVGVLATAYATQAPSIGVSEFAPAARESLLAPPTTSDASHAGNTASRHGTTTTTVAVTATPSSSDDAAASAPTTRVGRSRVCVGTPPRQTEDPLSPPCIATIFEGDNGGSTSRGVSSTEIRVGVPLLRGRGSAVNDDLTIRSLFEYVNTRFELYGRRLVPVFSEGAPGTSTDARAQAADLAAQQVFAAVTADADWGTPQPALAQTLAHNQVVTISQNIGTWWSDRLLYDESHPYAWSVYPSAEDVLANLADFACASLAGHLARFAGDPALQKQTRRFGVLSIGEQMPLTTRLLTDALAACTGEPPLTIEWTGLQSATVLQTALAQAQSSGVTTVFCVCEGYRSVDSVPRTAHQAGFHPEWILTPTVWWGNNDDEYPVQGQRRGGAMAPPIRLSAGPKLLPIQARPWFQALLTMDQSLAENTADALFIRAIAGYFYDQLLVLAAGLQGAGPNLTPSTFAAALMTTEFSNPNAGAPPYWQPSAGFGVGDHSFYDDYSIGWWSDSIEALNPPVSGPTGSWCYVGAGSRFRLGSYPTNLDERLFSASEPCR